MSNTPEKTVTRKERAFQDALPSLPNDLLELVELYYQEPDGYCDCLDCYNRTTSPNPFCDEHFPPNLFLPLGMMFLSSFW